jgi:hypothetical protein
MRQQWIFNEDSVRNKHGDRNRQWWRPDANGNVGIDDPVSAMSLLAILANWRSPLAIPQHSLFGAGPWD